MAGFPARFGRTLVSGYVNTIVTGGVAVLMTPILAHGLGRDRFGVWILVSSLVLYLELLEFGFGRATIKYVAEHEAVGDHDAVRRTIATSFWVLAVPGLGALVIGVVLALLFPVLFHLGPASAGSARILVLLLATDLAVSIPADTFGGALCALQRFDLVNATLVVVLVAQAVSWGLVLWLGGGLVALGVCTAGLGLLGQLARYLILRRLMPDVSISPRLFDRSLTRPFAGLSVWYAMRDIAEVVVYRIDAVVVGLVVGVPAAGVYAVGEKLAQVADKLCSPTMRGFFPHASALAAQKDEEGLRRTMLTGTRLSLGLATPLALALALLARPGVLAWVGPAFADAAVVAAFLAGALVVKSLTQAGLLMLYGMGHARVPSVLFASEAVLNLVLSVVLGRHLGLKGVAMATLLASVIMELVVLFPYMCRQLGVAIVPLLASIARAEALAVAAAAAVGLALRGHVSGVVPVGAAAVAVVGVYGLVFWLTGLDDSERRRVRSVVRRSRPEPASPDYVAEVESHVGLTEDISRTP